MDTLWYEPDAVKQCDCMDALLDLWQKAHRKEPVEKYSQYGCLNVNKASFSKDGFLNPDYCNINGCEILFIGKEGHEFTDEKDGSDNNFCDGKNFWLQNGLIGEHNKSGRFLNCLTVYCNAFQSYPCSYSDEMKNHREILNNAAFININKRGGFKDCNVKVLKGYVEQYEIFISKQIELIAPKKIVCLGAHVYDLVDPLLPKDAEIFTAYHPSARGGYAKKLSSLCRIERRD